MRAVRKLVLTKETLSELTAGELGAVHGGAGTTRISRYLECPTTSGTPCEQLSTAIDPCPTSPKICD